ncbi:MAG: sugar ABC transporter permease [Chloroflexota bacterium]
MADIAGTAPDALRASKRPPLRGIFSTLEIDLRLFGMLLALALILAYFGIRTDGKFLSPSNLVVLSIQASVVAVMATGMVLVIVSRNIDLSVGSTVGLVSMTYAMLMTEWMPDLGLRFETGYMWIVALALGLGLGSAIGAFQGFVIAYIGVPSFIVTLGGLLSLRGVVWVLSEGAAKSGLDDTFQLLGGGAIGSIGATPTWAIGIAAALGTIALLISGRRQRRRFGFPLRPRWADALLAMVGVGAVVGLAAFFNANLWPPGLATRYATTHGITEPPGGLQIPVGIPWPVVLVIGVTLVMTYIATRRRFGRNVFAYGGNPEAAELAGINTRWTILKVFTLMGLLCGISAAIAAARLNGSTLDIGQGNELYVIAAAVVGGTSLAGGIGTIPGAVLGALVMQTLAYGLNFTRVNSAVQNIVAGIVLVVAVGFDTYNRRRQA